MTRKKWTANKDITSALLQFREKRKWQVALRRYVLEKKPSFDYGPYFGLDKESFRRWIGLQLKGNFRWDNFGTDWQFDHIIPVAYFDFSKEEDLKLCWNFMNIRIETIMENKMRGHRVDVLAATIYFNGLYEKTGHPYCLQLLKKIDQLVVSQLVSEPELEAFIIEKKADFEALSSLSKDEFAQLNSGRSLADLILEREIIKKFG